VSSQYLAYKEAMEKFMDAYKDVTHVELDALALEVLTKLFSNGHQQGSAVVERHKSMEAPADA